MAYREENSKNGYLNKFDAQMAHVFAQPYLAPERVLWTRCETPMAVLANMTPGPSSLHARSNRDILPLAVPLAALDIDWIWMGESVEEPHEPREGVRLNGLGNLLNFDVSCGPTRVGPADLSANETLARLISL